jgi:hypothetical protein
MRVVLALVLAALPGAVPGQAPVASPPPDPRPQPQPSVKAEAKATPVSPRYTQSTLTGRASWYDYRPGQGAAGPRLRSMLGPDWRGRTVDVCVGDTCVAVTLTDWCQCYKGERRERIIDLDVRSFAVLAHPSAGLVKVTIRGRRRPSHRRGTARRPAAVRPVRAGMAGRVAVRGVRPGQSLT